MTVNELNINSINTVNMCNDCLLTKHCLTLM